MTSPNCPIRRVSVICKTSHSDGKLSGDNMIPDCLDQDQTVKNMILCPICSELAVDHSHYGGQCCFSCKAFFRRVVIIKRKMLKRFRCRSGGRNCDLKLEKRNNCPFCRFSACLSAGLKPSLVLSRLKQNQCETSQSLETQGRSQSNEPNQTAVNFVTFPRLTTIETSEDKLKAILAHHKLILSQTVNVNLLTVPTHLVTKISGRLSLSGYPEEHVVLTMAKMELAFLVAKESVTFFTESLTEDMVMGNVQKVEISQGTMVTAIQEYFVQILVIFLRNCPLFQSLTWACQARLLRKNVAEISLLLMVMCFEKNNQMFRWSLMGDDQMKISKYNPSISDIISVDKDTLAKYLNQKISEDIFQVINSLLLFEIPGHILILLILISTFTRDGQLMEKQYKVDAARNYYLQLLYKYMRTVMETESECSRITANIHRALKTIKDFVETIRSCEIVSVTL